MISHLHGFLFNRSSSLQRETSFHAESDRFLVKTQIKLINPLKPSGN